MRGVSIAGFTLIELVVTIGIMAVITGVTLANHTKFGGQVTLRNLAYEVALTTREAQAYGVSVRRSAGSTYTAGYGMHFDVSKPKQYFMFIDTHNGNTESPNGDGIYSDIEEVITPIYKIGRGYTIANICVAQRPDSVCAPVNTLDILFHRPEPDAMIRADGVKTGEPYVYSEVEVQSPRGDVFIIHTGVTGQVSVTNKKM